MYYMLDRMSNHKSALLVVKTVSERNIWQELLLKMCCEREMKHLQVDNYFRDGEQKQ